VDSWLLWKLTGGRVHATDVSNAARTMLFDMRHNVWDDELLKLLHVPDSLLPAVHPSSHVFGETDADAAGRVASDRPAWPATSRARCSARPASRPAGQEHLRHRLLHADAHRRPVPDQPERPDHHQRGAAGRHARFALEGSVFIGGAVVQWLRDGLRAISSSSEVQSLAESVPDAGGVLFVPAFTGLGAPYWNADARGTITGLTRGSTVAHIARAALESIAYQSAALLQAMSRDAVAAGGAPVSELRVDGGACVNDLLMQFQADLLGIPVVRPQVTETTALGAAYLAGLATGVYLCLRSATAARKS
jgi:glycerol kinase